MIDEDGGVIRLTGGRTKRAYGRLSVDTRCEGDPRRDSRTEQDKEDRTYQWFGFRGR